MTCVSTRDSDPCDAPPFPSSSEPAQALDWLAQVAQKTWATDMVMADLVRAMDDMLDLQGNLCGHGQPGTIQNVKAEVEGRSVQPVRYE
jgi:hypothetical protein